MCTWRKGIGEVVILTEAAGVPLHPAVIITSVPTEAGAMTG